MHFVQDLECPNCDKTITVYKWEDGHCPHCGNIFWFEEDESQFNDAVVKFAFAIAQSKKKVQPKDFLWYTDLDPEF